MSEHSVAIVTLGCTRNEVDSEELAGRLDAEGFQLVDDPAEAETVLVNTCGFIEQAKKDSVDSLLAAADLKDDGTTKAVVAVGCMAERYGKELADSLPEADAVLGFDHYTDIGERLRGILGGTTHVPHAPRDRRKLLPVAPVERQDAAGAVPGHNTVVPSAPDLPAGLAPVSGPRTVRRRLDGGPTAPLKLASGCDRVCSFCAIPMFRGSFLSRRPADILAEARWLAEQGSRELFLVSENSTSYGKDLGDIRLLESLLPDLAAVDGIEWVRVSYLQPAEMRPSLVEAMTSTPGVVPYFDLSFQHASAPVLRRMRRFGSTEPFLELIESIRQQVPTAGIRSNVIVGFPGETDDDVAELDDFLSRARLDVVGVFGYSDEDGTEAVKLDGKLDDDEIAQRVEHISALVDDLVTQRAEDRIGEQVEVMVESVTDGRIEGRAAHQGPDVDGTTELLGPDGIDEARWSAVPAVGDVVPAVVAASAGADLTARQLR
ncbi:30S ribosomal protein S12 methylthiotransferase RimO [Phytoactinopolyspora limicola]|uniref:30S ribosomal protein S12 methylthiotransferase RimO n=1 Tax=Phytoactinopolyspora limicola TaxID=2715536 RepID=UPI00140DF903|nr:30S ribosomal protein S12 methylthiotransferase RimO [Phytoactinopolyspora limicola]